MRERAARQLGRVRRGLVLAGALTLIALPVAVWAADAFTDVPPSNVHHDAITAIRDAGVTAGCAPSRYCPDDFVRRDQMASFLDRFGALSGQSPAVNAATAETAAHADHADSADTATTATTADTASTADTAVNAESAQDAETLAGLAPAELTPLAIVAGPSATTTSATTFEQVPTATTEITIPDGHEAVILTRFSAESACYGASGWCTVRILVDGTESAPAVGDDFAFDSTNQNNETFGSWESHAMERVSEPLPAGTYTVTVEQRVTAGTISFRLDDWLLVAEARLTS